MHLVVPGPITQVSGGYGYDRRMAAGLRALGHRVVVHELEGTFPLADDAARRAAGRMLEAVGEGGRMVIDGLALPAFEDLLDRLPASWAALVHHPLAQETGHPPARALRLRALEGRMLARAARVIVTSRHTAGEVAALGVPPHRVGVVEPGTGRRPLAPADGEPPHLLAVGALIPRKAHDVLVEALGGLRDRPWRLTCAGSLGDAATTRRVRELVDTFELGERVRLAGEVGDDELARLYLAADLFVLASRHEGYGMALAEALAHGLPVVSTRAGAIPGTVPEAAGLLVPPDDPAALRDALAAVLDEPPVRRSLRAGARAARDRLRSWEAAATGFRDQLLGLG